MKTLCKYFFIILLNLTAMSTINSEAMDLGHVETKVYLETNYGRLVLKLYNSTPLHRDNFLKLV
ncbi:MAG: peptidylprolyl isomerase, partial [Bacteroidota bacterium]